MLKLPPRSMFLLCKLCMLMLLPQSRFPHHILRFWCLFVDYLGFYIDVSFLVLTRRTNPHSRPTPLRHTQRDPDPLKANQSKQVQVLQKKQTHLDTLWQQWLPLLQNRFLLGSCCMLRWRRKHRFPRDILLHMLMMPPQSTCQLRILWFWRFCVLDILCVCDLTLPPLPLKHRPDPPGKLTLTCSIADGSDC